MDNGKFWAAIAGSFFIVAFGQGIWVPGLGIAAGAVGLALFWEAMRSLPTQRERFWLSACWFSFVQGVQISWLASTHYMGLLILLIYAFLCFGIALQFGLLSFFIGSESLSVRRCLAIAGFWVWMEWLRTFFLTGFTWNPLGFALTDSPFSLQAASLFGIYGLSFWVIFVNALALRAADSRKRCLVWALAALLPYAFGGGRMFWIQTIQPLDRMLSAALVHTPFIPEQRDRSYSDIYIPPLIQWEKIWSELEKSPPVDLIILPESTIALRAYHPYYSLPLMEGLWEARFGRGSSSAFPPLQLPLAEIDLRSHVAAWRVSNAFITQSLANYFQAHVIAGFEDGERGSIYNAAFHFHPDRLLPSRYEKQVLVPAGEYVPFPKFDRLTQFLADHFQISDSFAAGKEAKLFHVPIAAGISICLEETYSHVIRELRLKGAGFLINISNDVWFPGTRLPRVHFEHARVRSVENGVYSLRSCNKGITAIIDYTGQPLAQIHPGKDQVEILFASFPPTSLKTLYTLWGDTAILLASLIFLFIGTRRKSCP